MFELNVANVIFISLTFCFLLGIPIGYSLGIATTAGLLLTPMPLVYIAQTFFTGTGLFPLIAIPGFILAGDLMIKTEITDKIIKVISILIGRLPGGLGFVTMVACAFFASLSGSGPATTAAIGSIMIPAMVRSGYPVAVAAALAATGGTLGILIPPSNPMIIYGVTANLSVSGMFFSGFLPGILLTGILCLFCYVTGRFFGYQNLDAEPFSWKALRSAVWDGKWALSMPVIVLGTIYTGIATPTESAMLAVCYTMFTAKITGKFRLADVRDTMINTSKLTGSVLIIMGPAMAFGRLLVLENIPTQVAEWFLSISSSPMVVLVLIAMLLVFIGCFMETLGTIVLLTPIFLPVVTNLGVDPVQFGILFVVLSQIGFLTPPLGVNLFVASALSGVSIERISRAVLPLLTVLLLYAAILIFVPWISTWGYHFFIGM
jgi:C4-dicarboxylate transporter DctM subunit